MFRKSSHTQNEWWDGKHRREHWYKDNQVYFITSKVRGGLPLFEREEARAIFWDRFDHYTAAHTFTPWVTTLMNNHYHTLGYLRVGQELGEMMRKLHGSTATLVCKLIRVRHVPFWKEPGHATYFDGCIRDVLQAERAYRYTLFQAVKARIVRDWRDYPDTHVNVEMWRAIRRATELGAYMERVP